MSAPTLAVQASAGTCHKRTSHGRVMTATILAKKSGLPSWLVPHQPGSKPMPAPMNRRTILVGAATAGVVGAPLAAAAATPDPIFAAIEAHRRTWAVIGEMCHREAELEEIIPDARRRTGVARGDIVATDDARWILHCRNERAANDRNDEAEGALLDIVPTTAAGVVALLDYAAEYVLRGCEWNSNYVVDDARASGWVRTHGITWEALCALNCAKALRALAA